MHATVCSVVLLFLPEWKTIFLDDLQVIKARRVTNWQLGWGQMRMNINVPQEFTVNRRWWIERAVSVTKNNSSNSSSCSCDEQDVIARCYWWLLCVHMDALQASYPAFWWSWFVHGKCLADLLTIFPGNLLKIPRVSHSARSSHSRSCVLALTSIEGVRISFVSLCTFPVSQFCALETPMFMLKYWKHLTIC